MREHIPESVTLTGACEPLEIQASEGDGAKTPRFSIVGYTGAEMNVGFSSPIVVDISGVETSQTIPVLYEHDAERIVGHTDVVELSQQRIKLSGIASGMDDDAGKIVATAKKGFPWQASIGLKVKKREFIEAGQTVKVNGRNFTGPITVIRSGTLREVSFVSMGADGATSATVAAKHRGNPMNDEVKNEEAQVKAAESKVETKIEAADKPKTPTAVDLELVAVKRLREVKAACGDNLELYEKALEGNWTADQAKIARQDLELKELRESRTRAPAGHVKSHEKDCTLQALQGAMFLRAGIPLDSKHFQSQAAYAMNLPEWVRAGVNDANRNKVMELSHRYADMSLVDLCRNSLRLDHKDEPSTREEIIRAAFSGSTLLNIFTTNVGAAIVQGFMQSPDTSRVWTRETEVADFKTQERPRLKTMGGSLPKLPRGGTADHGSIDDQAESYKIARYAEQFVIDEQDIIDDAFNALSDIPMQMAQKAARVRPDLCYAILLANGTMADGVALFHADHSNLGTSGTLAQATLISNYTAMSLLTENSVNIDTSPNLFLGPPSLNFTIAGLLESAALITGATTPVPDKNVTQGLVTALIEKRLENGVTDPNTGTAHSGSATTWFLVNTNAPTVEVAYRRGTGRVPRVRSFMLDKGQYGMGWDISLDIGAKALEFRSMRKVTA